MDCGSLLPLSGGQPAGRRAFHDDVSPWRSRVCASEEVASATRRLRRQQGCLGKAAAGCRSPYGRPRFGRLQKLNASCECTHFPDEPIPVTKSPRSGDRSYVRLTSDFSPFSSPARHALASAATGGERRLPFQRRVSGGGREVVELGFGKPSYESKTQEAPHRTPHALSSSSRGTRTISPLKVSPLKASQHALPILGADGD